MKKIFVTVCIIAAFFFSGCGKKKVEKDASSSVVAEGVVQKQEIPLYQCEDDKFFDFDEGEVKDFAFIDADEEGEDLSVTQAEVVGPEDEWDDDGLTLAWEDESEKDESFETVNFDLNKNNIRRDQKPIVAKNVQVASEVVKSGKNIVVAGHCCPIGPPSYNMSLSERRAKAIRDEMVKGGISEDKVKIVGFGSECPIVLSDNVDQNKKIKELAPNRRAEISTD